MKKMILTIALLFSGVLIFAQPSVSDNLLQPIIEFESEIIDYGTIDQGSDGIREFKFTNTGNSPLIISEARRSCGCTVPSFPKEPIKPGESSIIKVKYDTKRIGAFSKSVTIVSNAKRSNMQLSIKGKIIASPSSPVKEKSMLTN